MEKEWYYGNADKERNGPVGFTEIKDLYKVRFSMECVDWTLLGVFYILIYKSI